LKAEGRGQRAGKRENDLFGYQPKTGDIWQNEAKEWR